MNGTGLDLEYGSRLLRSMGWSEGKGLGKNEDGMKEPLKVKKKFNTKGIGFNGVDGKWIEHQMTYEDILSELNGIANPEEQAPTLMSMEKRSRNLKGRVHYSKFLRGKDLSQKKEEDLKAIVISRKKAKTCSDEDGEDKVGPGSAEQNATEYPFTHTSSVSYQEYFAERMRRKRNADTPDGSSSVGDIECERSASPEEKSKAQDCNGTVCTNSRDMTGKKSTPQEQKKRRAHETTNSVELPQDGEDSVEAGKSEGTSKRTVNVEKVEEGAVSSGTRSKSKNRARLDTAESETVGLAEGDEVEGDKATPGKQKRRKIACADNKGIVVCDGEKPSVTAVKTEGFGEGAVSTRTRLKSKDEMSLDTVESETALEAENSKQEEDKGSLKKKKCKSRSAGDEAVVAEEESTSKTEDIEESSVLPKKKSKSTNKSSLDTAKSDATLLLEDEEQEEDKSPPKKKFKGPSAGTKGVADGEGESPPETTDKREGTEECAVSTKKKLKCKNESSLSEGETTLRAEDNEVEEHERPVKKRKKKHKNDIEQGPNEVPEQKWEEETKVGPVEDEAQMQCEKTGTCSTKKEEQNGKETVAAELPIAEAERPHRDSSCTELCKDAKKSTPSTEKSETGTAADDADKVKVAGKKILKKCQAGTDAKASKVARKTVCKGTKDAAPKKAQKRKSEVSTKGSPEGNTEEDKETEKTSNSQKAMTKVREQSPVRRKKVKATVSKKGTKNSELTAQPLATVDAVKKLQQLQLELQQVLQQLTGSLNTDALGTDSAPKKVKKKVSTKKDSPIGAETEKKTVKKKVSTKKDSPTGVETEKKTVKKVSAKKDSPTGVETEKKKVKKLGTKKDSPTGVQTLKKKVEKNESEKGGTESTAKKPKAAVKKASTKSCVSSGVKTQKTAAARKAPGKTKPDRSAEESGQAKAAGGEAEGAPQTAPATESCDTSSSSRARPPPGTPLTRDQAYDFACWVTYDKSINERKLKVYASEYVRCLSRDLCTVYSCTNLKDIPGYATPEWLDRSTLLVARALRDQKDGKSGAEVPLLRLTK